MCGIHTARGGTISFFREFCASIGKVFIFEGIVGIFFFRGGRRDGGLAMLLNIPGNVLKHSGEYCQIFRGMSSNIPGNVIKHSRECHQIFRGMFLNIPGNVTKHSGECYQKFRGTSPNIPGNAVNFWCKGQGSI